MVVTKVNGVYRGYGRGYGKPDIVILRGAKRWNIFEVHGDEALGEKLVLLASEIPFAHARAWDDECPPSPPIPQRKTLRSGGVHEFGPITIQKTEAGWRVFQDGVEYGNGMQFAEAKRLACIEEKKLDLAKFKLAMKFVPYSIKNINLHNWLTPYQWRKLCKETYSKAGGVCEICGTAFPRLDCHEDWEYDDFRRIQRLKRLIAICTLCHRAIHYNNRLWWPEDALHMVNQHFQSVNGVDGHAMFIHEQAAAWIYKMRNGYWPWAVKFDEYAELLRNYPRLYKGVPYYSVPDSHGMVSQRWK